MPYIKSWCKIGNTIEIEKYYAWRYGKKGISRSPNEKATSEIQKKINERRAEKHKQRILNANFEKGDIYLTFTYMRKNRPANMETAQKNIKRALDKMRRTLKRKGQIMKYIAITEIGSKGAVHHHVIVKKFDINIISDYNIWNLGSVDITPCYTNDLSKLAAYFTKQSDGAPNHFNIRKKWSQSRNLIIPIVHKDIIKSRAWRIDPKPPKGYEVIKDSLYNGICDFNGMPYQTYKIRKIE